MAFNDRILKALSSALQYANKSVSALESGDENSFLNNLWHVAAELEYALFLFSLALKIEQNVQMPKLNPNPRGMQTNSIMLKVKELIERAQNILRGVDLLNAHRNTYMARYYIFKLQENLDRKRVSRRKGETD